MSNPFQDQFLKAGLVSKQQVQKAKQDKNKKKKQQRNNKKIKVVDENKIKAQQAAEEKARRDRELNKRKEEQISHIDAKFREYLEPKEEHVMSDHGDMLKFQDVWYIKKSIFYQEG